MKPEEMHHADIDRVYSRLHHILLKKSASYFHLNLGYWKGTDNIKKACEQLTDLVISQAGIKNNWVVLDAGFGYGEQAVYMARQFPLLRIHGINIMAQQADHAQRLVLSEGLSERVSLITGDAVSLPYSDDTFDAVIAIESAFHFHTRELFFKEAYRVLKRGAVLCMADCLPPERFVQTAALETAAATMGIPLQNLYDIDEYLQKLAGTGFENIHCVDISEWVLPHSAVEMKDGGWRSGTELQLPDNKKELEELIKTFIEKTTIGKYYIISAEKKDKEPNMRPHQHHESNR